MEASLVLPVAGLILPPRFSLRLAGAGLVALLGLAVYANTPPGHDSDPFGDALLVVFAMLFFGAVLLGILARGVLRSWRGNPLTPEDFSAPRTDRALMAFAMVLPAGIAALWLGDVLAGNAAPWRTHLFLLAGLAGMALAAVLPLPGLIRAALLGFAAFAAGIVADSMRLDRQVAALVPKDAPYCLAIGPNRLPAAKAPPLMGLTAPKPILLVTQAEGRLETRRWSFRWHGFVRGGSGQADPSCTPTLP